MPPLLHELLFSSSELSRLNKGFPSLPRLIRFGIFNDLMDVLLGDMDLGAAMLACELHVSSSLWRVMCSLSKAVVSLSTDLPPFTVIEVLRGFLVIFAVAEECADCASYAQLYARDKLQLLRNRLAEQKRLDCLL